MQRNDLLHELHILHQTHQIIGEELDGRHRADAAGIQRGRMHMAAFHQAEHLARHAAHGQRFAIERAGEWIQRRHDVGDRAVTMLVCIGRGVACALSQTLGFVSFTICSQKSTPTRLS